MAVMAAGMHQAGRHRRIGSRNALEDRQGVHVRPETDRAISGRAALDDPDDAGPADPRDDFVASERAQAIGDHTRGAMHFVEQLRMGVKITPPFRDLLGEMGDFVVDGHGDLL